jgi:multicomponent Na+:H+ antiporter subunit B
MKESSDSPIIVYVTRLVVPFIQLFALYVIFHGHYSPGGGFQGGAMLGASMLLLRLSIGSEISQFHFQRGWDTPVSSLGVLIFAGTGLVCMVFGGNYLDYSFLPLVAVESSALRYWGIMFIEIGVGIAVMATMVSIFDDLLEDEHHD